jgi:hypothetical protein
MNNRYSRLFVMKLSFTPPPSSAERSSSVENNFVTNAASSSERSVAMSVLARAGDVKAENAEADSQETSAGEVLAVLVQAQHENDPRDNPSVTKKAGTPSRDRDHRLTF